MAGYAEALITLWDDKGSGTKHIIRRAPERVLRCPMQLRLQISKCDLKVFDR